MLNVANSLTVAVLTFRRPRDIVAILPLLVDQAIANSSDALLVDVLVVDNDPDGAAAQYVREFASSSRPHGITVRYENETKPGISAARNRALESSIERDLLVFIDDDERPSASWLALLIETFRSHPATAVVGPVLSEYEVEPEPWIAAGRFFARRRLPTGTRVDVAATNNLLIDLRWVRSVGLKFDLDFGITGGDDTMFTREIRKGGGEIVWCDEAIVYDIVPRHRITRRWVVLRALSSGNSWSLTSLKLSDSAPARLQMRARLTANGCVRIAGGIVRVFVGFVGFRQDQRARGVRTIARGTGMVLGAYGYRYREYTRS
jgi:succinoglycan biosynthesis protein ExoM